MDYDYIKILLTVFLACSGWLIANYLTTKRAVNAKKRELVTKYQIETFTALNTFFTYLLIKETPPPNVKSGFNKAISMLQLLGSQSQIDKFSSILKQMQQASTGSSQGLQGSDVHILLQDVRNELRNELQLLPTETEVTSMLSLSNKPPRGRT